MPTYAIGDIHGCNRTFQALLEQFPLQAGDKLILLGDLIDRGPDSKGVIDLVFRLREYGHSVVCLRGNHEQLMLEGFENEVSLEIWLSNGGRETLESFGISDLNEMPDIYLDFFKAMPYWYETGEYLCLHGGPDFSKPGPLENRRNLLWMRRWYSDIDYKWLGKRIILHGHTPVDIEKIKTQHKTLLATQYLNLDSGCVYAYMGMRKRNMGHLFALSLDDRKLIWQECVE